MPNRPLPYNRKAVTAMKPSDRPQHDARDRLLWQRFSAVRDDAGPVCPSPEDLAAMIDAPPTGDERAAIERHLAACSTCRETIADVRGLIAAQAAAPITAPPDVIARARALVDPITGPVAAPAPTRPRLDGMRLIPSWLLPPRLDLAAIGRWGLSAAASVVVCLLGYQSGSRSSAVTTPETDLVTEFTFGVGLDGPTDLDLLLAESEEGGVGS